MILQKRRKNRSNTIQEEKNLLPEVKESFSLYGENCYQLPMNNRHKVFKMLILIIVCSIFNYCYLFFKTIFLELKQYTSENVDNNYNQEL